MFKKIQKWLYKLGLRMPYRDIDGLHYLRRLGKTPTKGHPYVSDKDRDQYQQNDNVLIRSHAADVSAMFLCNSRSHIDRQVIANGLFSNAIIKTLIAHAAARSTLIDVGANVGTISIALSRRFPDADIHAFEPNPHALRRLEYNLQLNKITNLTVHDKGLGNKDQRLELNIFDDVSGDIGLSSFLTPTSTQPYQTQMVDVVTLDAYADRFKKPLSAIKIDVQGFEAEVLEGATTLIATHRPIIVLEHEDINFRRVQDALDAKNRLSSFFDEHRYEVFYITRYDVDMLLPVQWNTSLNGDLLALPVDRETG